MDMQQTQVAAMACVAHKSIPKTTKSPLRTDIRCIKRLKLLQLKQFDRDPLEISVVEIAKKNTTWNRRERKLVGQKRCKMNELNVITIIIKLN